MQFMNYQFLINPCVNIIPWRASFHGYYVFQFAKKIDDIWRKNLVPWGNALLQACWISTGLLLDSHNCGLGMRREMPGMFSPPSTSSETASYRSQLASRHMRHAHAVMYVCIAKIKRFRHTQRVRNLQFCASGKRPMSKITATKPYMGDKGLV